MRKINCNSYTIFINNWDAVNEFIEQGDYSSIFVIVDENTLQFCLPLFEEKVQSKFNLILTKSGEINKTIDSCTTIWNQMIEKGADRHSLCINLGGGVVGDMGGFAACTYMRGMDFVQMPTTLLSQVDASVGGKLGVDYDHFKNLIGIIQNPNAVFMFTDFLKTLPYNHLLSGFAEVVKHGLIRDAEVFKRLTQINSLSNINWEDLVHESVTIKKTVTDEDPNEKGLRKILNFGHTLGHAIESHALSNNISLLHGEAIAIGMIMESYLSYLQGFISEDDVDQIKKKIIVLFGHHPTKVPNPDTLITLMAKDKKNKGGEIMFSLLRQIGDGNYDQKVTIDQILRAIRFYKA